MNDIFITGQNIELWEKLCGKFNIDIEKNSVKEYVIFVRNNDATIYYDPSNICSASFTHELLHLNLDYYNFYLSSAIKRNMAEDPLFFTMFNASMTDPLCNFIEHKMIFNDYTKMGYPENFFIMDYFENKIDQREIDSLLKNYKIDNKINMKAAHFFVGKLASLFGDVNSEHEYTETYQIFKTLDSDLYDAVANLFVESIKHDYENADYMYNYRDIADNFHKKLIIWKNNNRFI